MVASPFGGGEIPSAHSMTSPINSQELYARYLELQQYVGWTDEDAHRVQSVAAALEPQLPALVNDFYDEIDRHPKARAVITGGQEQIQRLKGTLLQWLRELLHGPYDAAYVARRWRVGWRHVEIGLDQVYTAVALSRLRRGLLQVHECMSGANPYEFAATRRSLNTLIDLDLAIIEDAYQTEFNSREQRAQRLAAIGQVAGGIAHELRNPLNVVKTSAYFLLNAKSPAPAKVAEHLERIERHISRADGVITALSSFAKMPVPNLRPFSVRQCVEEALESNPVSNRVKVVIDCDVSLPSALADINQIRIVFGNLIRNASDAMPDGGQLDIQGKLDGDKVAVIFSDRGVGISPEDLNRIMEPLYSTKARGLGLGLAIVRAVLDKNKGTLHAVSALGQGSAFTVKLTAAIA